MRIGLFLPILLVAGVLIAWIHQESQASLRIVILESLASSTADLVVPAFKTALTSHLAAANQVASFERIHLATAAPEPRHWRADLRSADLVVSFGALAAETSDAALEGSTTPHLFAFVPRAQALGLMAPASASGDQPTTGISGQLPRGAAFAIAERLLASRSGEPLRIGLLHELVGDNLETTASLLATAGPSPGFVPIPFELGPGPEPGTLLSSVVTAAVNAVTGAQQIEAFWLALEPSAPLDLLVQAIESETGRPVIFAASEAAVAAGALMSLAPEPRSTGQEAAILAMRLLDGAPAGELLLRAPHRVDFALNLETADALGIIPPYELIELARGRLFR